MKKKRSNILLGVILILLSTLPVKAADSLILIPRFNQVTGIGLMFCNGWMADFRPDGSAQFVYGSNSEDVADAPRGSFLFENIYNLLIPHLSQSYKGKKEKTISVSLRVANQTFPTMLYLEDKNTIKKLVSELRSKAVPWNEARFKELLRKRPPMPDELEIPFTSLPKT